MECFDTLVMQTESDSRFDYIVADILRDKKSRWNFNYYSDPTSQWHVTAIRHLHALQDINASIRDKTKALESSKEKLKKTDPSDPSTKKQRTKIQSEMNDLINEISELKKDAKNEKPLCEEYAWLDYVCSKTIQSIYALRNRFQRDFDLEFLQKGITFTYLQHYKTLGKVLPSKPEPSSSCW